MNDNKKLIAIIFIGLLGLLLNSNLVAGELKVLHEKTFDVNPGELLELYTSTGDVKITTWGENKVYVKVLGNSKAEKRFEFSFERTSRGVKIVAEKEGGSWFSWFSSVELKYEIKVPNEFDSYIKTSGGDIDLSGVMGNAELKTSGGDIEANNTHGDFLAKTSGGDIQLLSHNGDMELSTSGGDVETRNCEGSLDARTSGGDIKLETANGSVSAGTSGGDVELKYMGVNKGISLSSSGGDITAIIPSDLKADALLKTSGGDVTCRFSSAKANKITSSKYEGVFNGGGEKLSCSTSGGDVTVRER